jgi:FkbM family methyltransferase
LLDIGAFHGAFSLAFAAGAPWRKIVAVDASPIAFARLLYNVHKNNFTNIRPLECALSDEAGVLRMHYEWEQAVAAGTGEGPPLLIRKLSGDDLCRDLAFVPDIIKIDTEGHEVKIVHGLAETIARHKPLVFLEIHPLRIQEEKDDINDLLGTFARSRYRTFSTDGTPISSESISQLTEDKRVIFMPARPA